MPRGDLLDLEPGEEILAVARASFRGAAAASTRATFALGSARMRMRAFETWSDAARASGFPVVPPDMIVAVSDRRVLFGRPTFFGRAPARYSSQVGLEQIAQVAAVRHGIVTGLALGFRHGSIVEVEAIRGRRLRTLARVLEPLLPRQ